MDHRSLRILAAVLAILLIASNVDAKEARIALVIGNGAYANIGKLANPPNDVRWMARTPRGLGFEVMEHIDADQRGPGAWDQPPDPGEHGDPAGGGPGGGGGERPTGAGPNGIRRQPDERGHPGCLPRQPVLPQLPLGGPGFGPDGRAARVTPGLGNGTR